MRHPLCPLLTLVLALLIALPAAAQADPEGQPPRLWLDDQDIQALRTLIAEPGTTQHEAYEAIKARVEAGVDQAYGDGTSSYRFSYRAQEAAMLAVLATDPAQRKRYADIAYEMIGEIYQSENTPLKGSGLARAMQSKGLAVAYNWLHDIWTPQQRADVEAKIDEALDAWPKFGHPNLGAQKASNWVAVTRGGEMMLLIARGDQKERAERYKRVKGDLLTHIRNGYGSLGVSQEGIGYTQYPGGFLLPAALAARDAGDPELYDAVKKKNWPTLAMYALPFQGRDRVFLQTGVGHSSNFNEGWTSLLLAFADDPELQPYYTFWYDRHMGSKSPMSPELRYDGERAGTLWALAYYPHDPQPQDPTGVLPPAVGDDHGYYFFRNRWQDADDILASVMADTVHHDKAWDQPEALALNLMAYDTRFIGGPGKTRESQVFSTLLVDPDKNAKWGGMGKETGEKVAFEPDTNGGYAIVGGGSTYKKVGVDDVKRHTLVRFSDPKTNAALISTLDHIESSAEHEYVWQAALGSEENDDGIEVETGSESGRPTFTLRGRDGGFVKGWVVAPADAELGEAGDPLRVTTTGTDADIWVVMFTGKGEPPAATITGSGIQSTFTLGGSSLKFDGERLSVAE